jgi:hypothetical protein
VTEQSPLPDLDRLSTLAALILLIFGLARIIDLPSFRFEFSLFSILVPISFNTRSVMLLLAAGLSVVGADWLVEAHPRAASGRRAVERWILPGLTALGIGSLLTRLSEGWQLWLGLLLTTLLLLAVFLAEYLTIDPEDPRRSLASTGLELLAYVLMFGTAFSFRVIDLRLVFLIPAALVASGAVAWRLFRLQQPEKRSLNQAAVAGWGFCQLAIGLHYWPLAPVRGSLFLVLFFYLEVAAMGGMLRDELTLRHLIELALLAGAGAAAIFVLA